MSLNEIATKLVAGCREGIAHENLPLLYAEDAVSVEPVDHGEGREAHGIQAIKGKHDWWDANFDVLGGDISDPFPHGDDRFAVIFDMQIKAKDSDEVSNLKEVAVYHVANDKIVREEFFYAE